MPNTSDLGSLDFDWSSDAISALVAPEYNHPDMSLDGSVLTGLDSPGPVDSAGYLPLSSQESSLHTPINAPFRSSDFPHGSNIANQPSEINSIAPQGPTRWCMSCGMTGYSPVIPTNACIGPNHGHHPLRMNNLGHPVDCNGLLPHNAPSTLTSSVSKRGNVQTRSEPSQPKIFKCKWEGCSQKRNHFRREVDLMRHIKAIHVSPGAHQCDVPECNRVFNRRDNLEAHARRVHQGL